MWVPFVPKPVQVANRGNRGLRILARLDGRTIDWAGLEMQPGDEPPEPFSA